MNLSTTFLAAALALGAAHTAHAADTWIPVGMTANGDGSWDAKAKSGELSADGNFLVIERFRPRVGNHEYSIVSIAVADCTRGFGESRAFSLAGALKFKSDFVLGGTTASDDLAAVYCGIAKNMTERTNASLGNI